MQMLLQGTSWTHGTPSLMVRNIFINLILKQMQIYYEYIRQFPAFEDSKIQNLKEISHLCFRGGFLGSRNKHTYHSVRAFGKKGLRRTGSHNRGHDYSL